MSTEIHEGPVSATRFFGGEDVGVCIQVGSAMPYLSDMGPGLGRFIQGPYADVVACAKAIVAFDANPKNSLVRCFVCQKHIGAHSDDEILACLRGPANG